MSRMYVSLDLETTGLNPERDAILEIGAVKFRGDRVLGTFSTLVKPGRSIPQKIVDLTGITQREVDAAPSLHSQIPRIARFVGDSTIVGHSVAFDLGFLRRHDLFLNNASLDTWELAQVLVPHADRYSLAQLAADLDIDLPATHRALEDALATHALFSALFRRATALPIETLREILSGARKVRWSAGSFFDDALRATASHIYADTSIGAQLAAKLSGEQNPDAPLFTRSTRVKALQPAEKPTSVDVDSLASLLEKGGALEQCLPGYEHRVQQIDVLCAVASALNRGDHLLVEAGTGTGKSLAYLLPAVHWAAQNRDRVVVSTNTINLQQQLISKDIPQLRSLLSFNFEAVVLKGRSHYLCAAQLNRLRRLGPRTVDEARMLAKILIWLPNTLTGEDDELALTSPSDRAAWRALSAAFEGCNRDRCSSYAQGQCFFYRARQVAEGAHLIVVNHALLLSDIAVEHRVLPAYKHLIVDEAQHLEDATANQLRFNVDQQAMSRLFRDIGRAAPGSGARGVLGDLLAWNRSPDAVPLSDLTRQQLYEKAVELGALVQKSESYGAEFFAALDAFVQEFVGRHTGTYGRRIRIDSGLRTQPAWTPVEIAWDNCSIFMTELAQQISELAALLSSEYNNQPAGAEDLASQLSGMERRVTQTVDQLNKLVFETSERDVCWLNVGREHDALSLHVAPLYVGSLVEEHLFHKNRSVILTSATLRVAGSFDFIRERLGAWEADELYVGSPFDFASSTLLYLTNDIPEPRQPNQAGFQEYQRALETCLAELVGAIGGRTMALFTSYSQLRTTARSIEARLAQKGISVLEQGDGTSRRQLLESFKGNPKTVLLGTRSFWEGVDVPGEALSCLAIVRLPFAVPSDPLYAARAEEFDNPFFDYFVPEAVLRFLQGFGRLIRSRADRGVVAVLDKRLLTKSYGETFLESLPGPTVETGRMSALPSVAARWIEASND